MGLIEPVVASRKQQRGYSSEASKVASAPRNCPDWAPAAVHVKFHLDHNTGPSLFAQSTPR